MTNTTGQSHSVLNSWKEIARYLDRGVRTVQRWEQALQLPVHRIGKGKRSPVYAVVPELKFWMLTSGGRNALNVAVKEETRPPTNVREREAQIVARLHQLVQVLAESSVRHQRQVETLDKNICALRSRFSRRNPNSTNTSADTARHSIEFLNRKSNRQMNSSVALTSVQTMAKRFSA